MDYILSILGPLAEGSLVTLKLFFITLALAVPLGLARALVRIDAGASLLLLDEPTAGLDADAEASLLRSLRGTNVAAIVVSHRAAVLAEADRVLVIGGQG